MLKVVPLRRSGEPAVLGNDIVGMLTQKDVFSESQHLVADGWHVIRLAGCAKPEPFDFPCCCGFHTVLQVPVSLLELSDHSGIDGTTVPMIHAVHVEISPAPEPPPPERLGKVDEDQLDSIFCVWDALLLHLPGMYFDLQGEFRVPSVCTEPIDTLREFTH